MNLYLRGRDQISVASKKEKKRRINRDRSTSSGSRAEVDRIKGRKSMGVRRIKGGRSVDKSIKEDINKCRRIKRDHSWDKSIEGGSNRGKRTGRGSCRDNKTKKGRSGD